MSAFASVRARHCKEEHSHIPQKKNLTFQVYLPGFSHYGGAVGGADRAKHIDLREHFVHEAQSNKILQLEPVDSADNVADLLTKPLLKGPFFPLRKRILGFLSDSDTCSEFNSNTVSHKLLRKPLDSIRVMMCIEFIMMFCSGVRLGRWLRVTARRRLGLG
jgi:hypothetical protein